MNSAQADPKYYLYQRFIESKNMEGKVKAPPPNSGKFDQLVDHFAAKGTKIFGKTFKQRYFVDASAAKGPSSPVIYYLCGEGTCDGPSSTPEVNALAKKYGAYRVALEHRYYGYSQPFPTLTPVNMQFLSMDQAIEDLATFQRSLQQSMKLTGKWISMGGSYPGELSAFYRLKHPELVAGALASSAPVLAKADFFEYDRHVARVAGPECLAAIKKVVSDVEAKLHQTDSAAQVKALFKASDVKDNVDFLYVLADMAATAIQYGYQDSFCGALKAGMANNTATESYAKAGNELFANFGLTALHKASIRPII